ncbi:MAG: hypothetical protein MJ181_10740 [Treponema sp.]|nr:hypothetical protein [Treponema sp.]
MGGKGSGVNATGRKRKSPEGRISFSVSCTKEEREGIRRKAEEEGMTISDLILQKVLNKDTEKK